jgi:hypothetical protein
MSFLIIATLVMVLGVIEKLAELVMVKDLLYKK